MTVFIQPMGSSTLILAYNKRHEQEVVIPGKRSDTNQTRR